MIFHWPVAALDQHVRVAIEDARMQCVFVKPGDPRDAFQYGEQRHAVVQCIDSDNQVGAQAAGLCQMLGDDASGRGSSSRRMRLARSRKPAGERSAAT